jgi:hypothetical protein
VNQNEEFHLNITPFEIKNCDSKLIEVIFPNDKVYFDAKIDKTFSLDFVIGVTKIAFPNEICISLWSTVYAAA